MIILCDTASGRKYKEKGKMVACTSSDGVGPVRRGVGSTGREAKGAFRSVVTVSSVVWCGVVRDLVVTVTRN